MADQAITALPKKTYSGSSQIASTDYLLGIDSAEGYQMLIQDLGEYIINRATASLAGSTQTLASAISALNSNIPTIYIPKYPREKDITSYVTNGEFYSRLNAKYSGDVQPGDYIKMSRAITCPNIDGGSGSSGTGGATGSQYVTVADIGGLYGNGDSSVVTYPHYVMVPGQGCGGTQHFGQHRMNATNTTEGGYQGSVMNQSVIGPVVSSGSTASGATINQQLYAEFGSHLKTIREICSNAVNTTYNNRYGQATGAASAWAWASFQAILMSEAEVYGTIAWSSSGFDAGSAHHQFELFARARQAINNRSAWYWLRDVASGSAFAISSRGGNAANDGASYADYCVRPRFILAA